MHFPCCAISLFLVCAQLGHATSDEGFTSQPRDYSNGLFPTATIRTNYGHRGKPFHSLPPRTIAAPKTTRTILERKKPRRCCLKDPCGSSKVCGIVGRRRRDSCGTVYTISSSCRFDIIKRKHNSDRRSGRRRRNDRQARNEAKDRRQSRRNRRNRKGGSNNSQARKNCCYTDACNNGRICAAPGKWLRDSCGNSFKILLSCRRKRNQPVTVPTVPVTITPPRFRTFPFNIPTVPAPPLEVPSNCCFTDACNHQKICSRVGGQLGDSCNRNYLVQAACILSEVPTVTAPPPEFLRNCCFTDACNHRKICSRVGGQLVDSCHRNYLVQAGCILKLH